MLLYILATHQNQIKMSTKNQKTTTYSLDWDTVVNLESRLLRDFQSSKSIEKSRELLMISIGTRLGLRVIDNLNLKWNDRDEAK